MSFKKIAALALTAAMSLSLLAGCKKDEGDTINIGVLGPKTGDVAVYGIPTINGIELAAEEINKKGGINGKKINLIVYDDKGEITEATNAYDRLMGNNVAAIIGSVISSTSIAVAERAAEDGIPTITPTGTAAAITEKGKNVFRVCFTDPFQGEVMAAFAAEKLNLKKVGVLYNKADEYSEGIAKAFEAAAKAKGITVLPAETYGSDDTDFKTQLNKLNKEKPEAIIVPDYTPKVALIAPQAKEIGFAGTLLGGDGWDGVFKTLGDNKATVNGSYFTNHFSPNDTAEIVANFVKNYTAKYDSEPASFSALGYDAVYLMAKAIEKAGSTDYEKVTKELQDISLDCVTGSIKFDKNGDPIKDVAIIKLNDGKYDLFDKISK